MMTRIQAHRWAPALSVRKTGLLLGLILALWAVGVALAAGNIDATNKYAWGTNVGWINFAPDNGGVTVFSDHLEGDAWGENVGWIRLGTHTGGGTHTYANDAAGTYGVNNDGVGNLSGYAWGTNIGWINFAPTNGGVWADPVTGAFEGYAWGENVGWIRFQNASPAYKVSAGWRGDLTSTYTNTVAAIITTHRTGSASSSGLAIANSTFLNAAGDGIIFGHNNAPFNSSVTTNLPGGVGKRWARIWQLDVNDVATTGGNVTLTFDISDAGGSGNFVTGETYSLLKRATGSTDAFSTVSVVSKSAPVDVDYVTFTVDVSNLGSEFTIGAASSPTAVQTLNLAARGGGFNPNGVWALGGLIALGLGVVGVTIRRRNGKPQTAPSN